MGHSWFSKRFHPSHIKEEERKTAAYNKAKAEEAAAARVAQEKAVRDAELARIAAIAAQLRNEIETWYTAEVDKAKVRYEQNKQEYTTAIAELNKAYEERKLEIETEFRAQEQKIITSKEEEQAYLEECNLEIIEFLKEVQSYHTQNYFDAENLSLTTHFSEIFNKFNESIIGLQGELYTSYETEFLALMQEIKETLFSLKQDYDEAIRQVEQHWLNYQQQHNAYMANLGEVKATKLREVDTYVTREVANIEAEYKARVAAINAQLQSRLQEIDRHLAAQLKQLRHSTRSALLSLLAAAAAGAAAYFSGGLLSGLGGTIADSIRSSLGLSSLGALANLANGKDGISIGISANVAQQPRPRYVPAPPVINTKPVKETSSEPRNMASMPRFIQVKTASAFDGHRNSINNYFDFSKSAADIDLTPSLGAIGNKPNMHSASVHQFKQAMMVEHKNLVIDKGLEQRLNTLKQQKHVLEHDKPSTYTHSFNKQKYEESFIKAGKDYEQLLAKHQQDSDFYYKQQATLESQTGLFKGTAAAIAADDLEQSLGKKIFAQANDLRRLQDAMRSYVAQDIATQINDIKRQLSLEEVASNDSVAYDIGAKIAASSANILRETKLHLDGFAARHNDAMKVMSATAAVAGVVIAPAASVAGLATHVALSSNPVQRKMTHAFDATMQRLGVDKFSREDLSEFASDATTFALSGIGAAKLPDTFGKSVTFGKWAVNNHNLQNPITFRDIEGTLYSGIPLDAIKLRSPIVRKRYGIDDPTKKPHPGWTAKDILSHHDLNNPVPLTNAELEVVSQWMFERMSLLERWAAQDLSKLDQGIKAELRGVKNQLRDHMQPKDLAGILKENRGVKIYDKNGKVFKHDNEWADAKASMKSAMEAIKAALHDGKTSVEEAAILETRISDISKLWDRYTQLMEKAAECQNKPRI